MYLSNLGQWALEAASRYVEDGTEDLAGAVVTRSPMFLGSGHVRLDDARRTAAVGGQRTHRAGRARPRGRSWAVDTKEVGAVADHRRLGYQHPGCGSGVGLRAEHHLTSLGDHRGGGLRPGHFAGGTALAASGVQLTNLSELFFQALGGVASLAPSLRATEK
jgi:hypothetical protein